MLNVNQENTLIKQHGNINLKYSPNNAQNTYNQDKYRKTNETHKSNSHDN